MSSEVSKVETAKRIAKSHYSIEPDMQHIFLLEPIDEENPREPIKLLEVMHGAIERWIEPVSFPANPASGIHFASMIVELSPQEFERINPDDIPFRSYRWKLGQELPR